MRSLNEEKNVLTSNAVRFFVVGCWLLVVGCWLLVVGCCCCCCCCCCWLQLVTFFSCVGWCSTPMCWLQLPDQNPCGGNEADPSERRNTTSSIFSDLYHNLEIITGLWLNQPIWKICSSKWVSSPILRGENKTYLKPPPSYRSWPPVKMSQHQMSHEKAYNKSALPQRPALKKKQVSHTKKNIWLSMFVS